MAEAFTELKKLPSRKELRLARQAAERQLSQDTQNAQDMPQLADAKQDIQHAPQNATQPADATQALPLIAETRLVTPAQRRAFNAKFASVAAQKSSSFIRTFVRKSPALSAVAIAGILVASSVGVMKVQNAVGAAEFREDESVLSTVHVGGAADANADSVNSDLLKPTAGAAELAKIIETQSAANSGKLRCLAQQGANNLSAAYEVEAQNQVFFPMRAGEYSISSPFGMRQNPLGWGSEFHTGVDFAAPAGTAIYAVADGEVVLDGSETAGNHDIRIRHEINGEVFYTWYLHSYRDGIFVKAGQRVKAGEKIAEVGSSGRSTGPHLHFEIRPTKDYSQEAVEPIMFISKLGAIDLSQKCEEAAAQ